MTKEYRTDPKPPSDMFIDSLNEGGIGSDELTCDWCGRQHLCPDYLPDTYSFETTEEDVRQHREACEEEFKNNPNGVVLHYECDAVIGRYLNDMLFVLDCPCNGLHRYEDFIWKNRNTIRKFLKVRIEQEHAWAEQELTLNKIAGIS